MNKKRGKRNKIIGLIRRFSVCLPRKALLTIYKSLVRPHLNYCDILYDKTSNVNIESKIEKVQYKTCITITSAVQGTSREQLYDELGLKLTSTTKLFFAIK